jgi:hypothetical protein
LAFHFASGNLPLGGRTRSCEGGLSRFSSVLLIKKEGRSIKERRIIKNKEEAWLAFFEELSKVRGGSTEDKKKEKTT